MRLFHEIDEQKEDKCSRGKDLTRVIGRFYSRLKSNKDGYSFFQSIESQ
jgi:hypothetical protein